MFKNILFAILLMLGTNLANAAECSIYEQSHPSFLLSGAHLSTGKCSTCASCHKGGVFMGTPRTCIACHDGDPKFTTVSRSISHIPTDTIDCAGCHGTITFMSGVHMNHTLVAAQRCDTCHNGNFNGYGSRGKSRDHLTTIADCNVCHKTNNWDVSHAAIHAGVVTNCISCHDNLIVAGKALTHPITSDACETCHSIDAKFKCAIVLPSTSKVYAATNLFYNKVI